MDDTRFPWEEKAGITLHARQRESVEKAEALGKLKRPRLCLYYKTGAGKTLTALACMKVMGHELITVIAPPTTHHHWVEQGEALDLKVEIMSHQKFRQPGTKLSRTQALIVDEFHMLGGYRAVGFKKLEKISGALEAPLVIASATPNYNDVERCYCIQRITDRWNTEGGYLAFIYRHCATEVNAFGHVPRVVNFLHYPGAPEFLADMKNVEYIEDDLVYDIEDIPMDLDVPSELMSLGLDRRRGRMLASTIERKHALIDQMFVTDGGLLEVNVLKVLVEAIDEASTPVLMFATHVEVAKAAARSLVLAGYSADTVHGKQSKPQKNAVIDKFRSGKLNVMVGTQTLATGTDGLDKMCDMLVIIDDTEDNAMRRQLVGRIMPRGHETTPTHSNRVLRVVPEPCPRP